MMPATLPVRWRGLGIRGITSLASSAFVAYADATRELASLVLPIDGVAPLLHLELLLLTTCSEGRRGGGIVVPAFPAA